MKRTYDVVLSGNPLRAVVGATITVNHAGGSAATLYSDSAGTILLANPVTTDARGAYSFYVADGHYDLIFQGTLLTTLAVTDLTIADGGTTAAPIVNVEDSLYGAVGNGTTDDGPAIALAEAAVAAAGGGTLWFPRSGATYRTTLRLNVTSSHTTIDGNHATILFDPSDAVTNDRWLGISSVVPVTTRPITGALAIGATTAVVTNAGDVTDLVADDWLIVTEFDGVEPFAVDWAQYASRVGTTITLRAPLRTAFPGTHGTVQFQRVTTLTSDVTVRNVNLRMTATPATTVTGITVGTARHVTLDSISARMLNGSGMSTYLAADLTVTNCLWQAIGLTPEFASTVDLVVTGCTFGVFDAAPTASALLIDFGTAFFAVTNNRLINGGNILCQIGHGVHDGVFSGNVLSWCLDVGIGVGQGITGYGCTRVVVANNVLDGGTTGAGNSGIAFITDTTLTPNVVSSGNLIAANAIRGFTFPIPAVPAVGDTYLQPTLIAIPGDITAATVTTSGSITAGGYLVGSSGTGLAISGAAKSFLTSPTNGKAVLQNAAFTAGIGFDVTTDGTVSVRDRALSTAGNLVAGDLAATTYHVGATAGIDGSVTTAGLVGKTLTFAKGVLVGFA